MRAPPESLMPMIGTRLRSASSWTLTIFSAVTSPCDPAILHAEAVRAVRREEVELHERAVVHQRLDALARSRQAPGAALVRRLVLGVKCLVPAFAVLVDLLLRNRRRSALRRLDTFDYRRRPAHW